ncbi:MAG: ABC transporter permease [Tannerellaceae bacterium]|nr:ABC transporter permease [Tannerellaceae bacterium]
MIKSIVKQILNRRKSNFWVSLEILLVFCFLWYIVDYFFVLNYNSTLLSHRDIDNTVLVEMGIIKENHSKYTPTAPEEEVENFRRFINQVRSHPDVEKIGLCSASSYPGSLGQNSSQFKVVNDTLTSPVQAQFFFIMPGEDYFGVFRHTSNGQPFSLTHLEVVDPNSVIITKLVEEKLFSGQSAVGKSIQFNRGDDTPYRIIAVIDDIKRFSYLRPVPCVFFLDPVTASKIANTSITLRLRPGVFMDKFIEEFKKDKASDLGIGNFYLKNVSSLEEAGKRTVHVYSMVNEVRLHTGLMIFFLANILLCIIGTFWYRIHARMKEIGLRRAIGSTKSRIRSLLVWEGLILLLFVLPICLLLEMQVVRLDLLDTLGYTEATSGMLPDQTALRFIITNGITLLIMVTVMVVSILLPSLVINQIPPTEALRDE